MPKYRLMFARFPGHPEHPCEVEWCFWANQYLAKRQDITDVVRFRIADTPITMGRNRAVRAAMQEECDFLLMIDNDMEPDPRKPNGELLYAGAKLFLPDAIDFLLKNPTAGCVAAPYCGPSPDNNIYVFRWRNRRNKNEVGMNPNYSLEQYTREEAADLSGIQEVGALPTGLVLYNVRAFFGMKKPFFYYEWTDAWQSEKASTEDVTQTRDMSLAWYTTNGERGGRVFCHWDAWAKHIKPEHVGKPEKLTAAAVGDHLKHAINNTGDKVCFVGGKEGRFSHVFNGERDGVGCAASKGELAPVAAGVARQAIDTEI